MRFRGTTCTWTCGTLWLTTLFMATNDPALAVASWTAAATRCTWAKNSSRVASSRSRRVSTWARGHHERVAGEQRPVVEEGDDVGGVEHEIGRVLPRHDRAEETAVDHRAIGRALSRPAGDWQV